MEAAAIRRAPLGTLALLVEEFGWLPLIECLAQIAKERCQNMDHHDENCRALSMWFAHEVEGLLTRMRDFIGEARE
jgi:hypothetical protein